MAPWTRQSSVWLTAFAGFGVVAGLVLLGRGMRGYRSLLQVADTSTSTISSIAAGEVRISGTIEPAEMTLVSLLQSTPCVYYRSTVGNGGDARMADSGYTEERSIGFRVRDPSGCIRVFPRGARFDAPVEFEGETGMAGDEPSGLNFGAKDRPRSARWTVHWRRPPCSRSGFLTRRPPSRPACSIGAAVGRYRETRLEPGDAVTIVGRALPFADLADPAGADVGTEPDPTLGRSGDRGRPGGGPGDRSPGRRPDGRRGAMPRSRGSASDARSVLREIDPRRHPLPLAAADEAAARSRGPSRSRPDDAGPRRLRRGAAADRVRDPGAVVERRPDAVPGRPARRGPGHRLGDGRRGHRSVAGSAR